MLITGGYVVPDAKNFPTLVIIGFQWMVHWSVLGLIVRPCFGPCMCWGEHTTSPKDAQGGHNTPLLGGWWAGGGVACSSKEKTKSTSHIQNPQPPKCNWGVWLYIVTFLNSYGNTPKFFFFFSPLFLVMGQSQMPITKEKKTHWTFV
jgi:hypothetical protein